VVPAALAGVRVDRALSFLTGMTRSEAAHLIDAGGVAIDGVVVLERNRKLREGQHLAVLEEDLERVSKPLPSGSEPVLPFTVVHSDPHLIVVDKPAGLVVHHGAGHEQGTLLDGLIERFPDIADLSSSSAGDPDRPGIVHRLDKGTSGLIVVARTPEAFDSLTEQLRTRRAGRTYLALVAGTVVHDDGLIDAPVGRSGRVATRMAVTPKGRAARTAYKVLERFPGPPEATLIEATLETGRTHQVRVHMAAIGHPVGGDDRYGETSRTTQIVSGAEPPIAPGRLFLHAHRLEIDHPAGGRVSWTSPLPDDLEAVLRTRRAPNP
jgi:23S rRNA pseudouridine1911/1915/1917 synthase